MWADVQYYIGGYLLGRQPAIPTAEFAYWEKAARTLINRRNVTLEEIPDALKMCVCEVAEALFRQNQAPKAGDLKSESNGGYSWTAQEAQKAEDFDTAIRGIVSKHLAFTELHNSFIYSGVG